MPRCQECNGHVTDSFRRVFSGNDGVVHGCPDCVTYRELLNGDPAEEIDETVVWE
jgi:hypothetical protein